MTTAIIVWIAASFIVVGFNYCCSRVSNGR